MTYAVDGKQEQKFVIRLSDQPDYWVFSDLSAYLGKTLTISYEGDAAGLSKIYQDDQIAGQDSSIRSNTVPSFISPHVEAGSTIRMDW